MPGPRGISKSKKRKSREDDTQLTRLVPRREEEDEHREIGEISPTDYAADSQTDSGEEEIGIAAATALLIDKQSVLKRLEKICSLLSQMGAYLVFQGLFCSKIVRSQCS